MNFVSAYSPHSFRVVSRFQAVTLFDEPHFTRRAFLPQAEAVAALGASDGGVLRGDPALAAPGDPLHIPLLLLVREGALPLLALRCCGWERETRPEETRLGESRREARRKPSQLRPSRSHSWAASELKKKKTEVVDGGVCAPSREFNAVSWSLY